jgi:hypothetical protein
VTEATGEEASWQQDRSVYVEVLWIAQGRLKGTRAEMPTIFAWTQRIREAADHVGVRLLPDEVERLACVLRDHPSTKAHVSIAALVKKAQDLAPDQMRNPAAPARPDSAIYRIVEGSFRAGGTDSRRRELEEVTETGRLHTGVKHIHQEVARLRTEVKQTRQGMLEMKELLSTQPRGGRRMPEAEPPDDGVDEDLDLTGETIQGVPTRGQAWVTAEAPRDRHRRHMSWVIFGLLGLALTGYCVLAAIFATSWDDVSDDLSNVLFALVGAVTAAVGYYFSGRD